MANVTQLHEMIDALSDIIDVESKGSFLRDIAINGLKDAERALKGATAALVTFENQDLASADDSEFDQDFKFDPYSYQDKNNPNSDKKYHDQTPHDPNKLRSIKDDIIAYAGTIYNYGTIDNNHIIQGIAVDYLNKSKKILSDGLDIINSMTEEDIMNDKVSHITPEKLREIVVLASEFDKSGDPLLMKQAAVLDEILLTIGAQKSAIIAAKRSQDLEVARLKALAEGKEKNPYTVSKEVHDKSNHVAEAQKEISKIKEYRPMESPLNTRTCPDHPGAQMARVAEHTYQCSLDKNIYNYETGYATMKGNNVPGGSVSNQTQSLYDRPNEFTSFETRENKLNPIN